MDRQAQDAAGKVQEQAGRIVDTARQQAVSQMATQKSQAASSLGLLADALRDAGNQVRDQDNAMIANYVDSAADQIDQLSETLREQNVLQLIDSLGRFGRREPGLFLAGAFALGFIGARFLRSGSQLSDDSSTMGSSWRGSWSQSPRGYGAGGYGQRPYGSWSAGSGQDQVAGYGMRSDVGASSSKSGYGTSESRSNLANDKMLGSEWPSNRGFDTGPEGQ
jgi:hypothetical protein